MRSRDKNKSSSSKKRQHQNEKRRNEQGSKPGHDKKKSRGPSGGGGFGFVDRSGRVHGTSHGFRDEPRSNRDESRHGERRSPQSPSQRPVQSNDKPSSHFKNQDRPFKKSGKSNRPRGFQSDEHSRGRGNDRGRGGKSRGRSHRQDRSRRPQFDGPLTIKASIDKNHKGFAFLVFESKDFEDAYLSPRDAERFFHGDRVEVHLTSRGEVREIKVLEHRFRELVGRFTQHPSGRDGWVVYERKRAREEVYIPDLKSVIKAAARLGGSGETPTALKNGDWVRTKLHFHEKGPYAVTGEIIEVYGEALPPRADVEMIAAEFNLLEAHSSAAEAEARAHRLEVPGKDLKDRVDLRSVPFITIDGETARDFDDAVYVERDKSGYVLWVAIADVSHYVLEGSALDKEARSRGTSVYFPERAFHMLPRALSESLCSLRPNEPRLAMVAKMNYDAQGNRHKTELMEAVIESKRRATYNQIQDEWDARGKEPGWEYAPHAELYWLIRKSRSDRGSIDFELPEAELLVQPTGEVISITNRARKDAHRLIEEFMIAANEAVTEWMLEREWPFVYRVHEEPAAMALQKFQSLAANVGVNFNLDRRASPKIMADLVRSLEGHPAQTLLNMALLRSLKQAVYSATHGIHFGLASEGYTHFTSPIRRYPDLVVHRLLRYVLRMEQGREKRLNAKEKDSLAESLQETCEHCSYRERLAADAERESIKLKQVRLMQTRLGEEFEGKIVGMIEAGLFIQLSNPYVEGLVAKESMTDDFYQFNEDRMVFYGRRTQRTLRVGEPVKIRVLKADIDKRQIDFGWVS